MASLRPGYETKPSSPVRRDFRPPDSAVHVVTDGEDWSSVANRYGVAVYDLIWANFQTLEPREINWYLREYVRCDRPTPDGKNWKFSYTARYGEGPRPGIVFVPLDWKALFFAARSVTQRCMPEWFERMDLFGLVEGPALIVQKKGCEVASGWRSYLERDWKWRFLDIGVPHELADRWVRFLLTDLTRLTRQIRFVHPGAFPSLATIGPFLGGHTWADPFPLFKFASRYEWRGFSQVLTSSGVRSLRAALWWRDYEKWFRRSFDSFLATAVAIQIRADVRFGSDPPSGVASGRANFFHLAEMPLSI